jgi:hypothetical protein
MRASLTLLVAEEGTIVTEMFEPLFRLAAG